MRTKEFNENKGITLIALVITIIVLLLLAGVAVNTLAGENGLINKTISAKNKSADAEIVENIKLAYINAQVGKYAVENETFTDVMKNDLEAIYGENSVSGITDNGNGTYTLTLNNKTYDIDENGNVTKQVQSISIDNDLKIVKADGTPVGATEKVSSDIEIFVVVKINEPNITDLQVKYGNTTIEPSSDKLYKMKVTTNDDYAFVVTGKIDGNDAKANVIRTVSNFSDLPEGLTALSSEVIYEPTGEYDWLAKYSTSYAETIEGEGQNAKTVIRDADNNDITSIKLATIPTGGTLPTGATDMSITKWRVLKIDENEKVYLVPSSNAAATPSVTLHGAQGYNNAVNLLDEACSELYGNEANGIKAESIDMELIEGLLKEVEDAMPANTADSDKKWTTAKTNAGYEIQMKYASSLYQTSGYTVANSKYPVIYAQESLSVIGATSKGANEGLGMSSKPNSKIERSAGTSTTEKIGAITKNSSRIKPYQTYYIMSNSDFYSALGNYARILLPKGSTGVSTNYCVASRCVNTGESNCSFHLHYVGSGTLNSNALFNSKGTDVKISRPLFPVVSLRSKLIKKVGNEYKVVLPTTTP